MSKKVYTVSKHGKERVRQRTTYSKSSDIKNLFRQAIVHGKSPSEFEPPFSLFLKAKLKNGIQIKVFKNMIFIYKGRLLITSYKVPNKYAFQLSVDKKKKSILHSFNGVNNKRLKESFVTMYDMLLSKCQIAEAIEIPYDEITYREMVENSIKLQAMIDTFRCRLTCEVSTCDDNNILHRCRVALEDFMELTKDYVGFGANKKDKTKGQRNKDTEQMGHILDTLDCGLDYMSKNQFLLRKE